MWWCKVHVKVHVAIGVRMNKRTDRCVIVMSLHTHCLRPNPAPVGLFGACKAKPCPNRTVWYF